MEPGGFMTGKLSQPIATQILAVAGIPCNTAGILTVSPSFALQSFMLLLARNYMW